MVVGEHAFDGKYIPSINNRCPKTRTFSVGIFEWVKRASGNGLKRSPVKVRVRGNTRNYKRVFAEAEEIAKLLDDGKYDGPKTVRV